MSMCQIYFKISLELDYIRDDGIPHISGMKNKTKQNKTQSAKHSYKSHTNNNLEH